MNENKNIYSLDLDTLAEILNGWEDTSYRAKQIWQGLYKHFWTSPDEFKILPKKLRDRLKEEFAFPRISDGNTRYSFQHLTPTLTLDSIDGQTKKTLFVLPDNRPIEAVLMEYDQRRTFCISSQSGCAMGCVFCATGKMGFGRNLSSGEIVEQVIFYAKSLAAKDEKVTNVVIMGMGEPFHNYDATLAAIDLLNDINGMNLGERRFTISTVGLVPAINRFADEKRQINLAVSLHAANDELRNTMLPINRRYPLHSLMEACRRYISITHRRISFEWALINGVNDTIDQARELASLLKTLQAGDTLLAHVNAIPLNPIDHFSGQAANRARAIAFKNNLQELGIPCTIRLRRGVDIQAGCGQLAGSVTISSQ